MSIYDKNRVLLLPLTTKKTYNTDAPSLNPIDCDIFDCCASYIKKDFEDWDILAGIVEPPKELIKKAEKLNMIMIMIMIMRKKQKKESTNYINFVNI